MGKKIAVLDADEKQCLDLCAMIEKGNYPTVPIHSLPDLERCCGEQDCLGVFIDVDTVPVTDRVIRDLALKHTGTYFFCLSKYRFHPELENAICYHVYACLNRPIDLDELFYWLKSIYEDDKNDPTPKK